MTRTWDDGDPNDSFWDSSQNWSDDTQPGPADDAVVGGNPEVNTFEVISNLDNSGTINITTGTLQPNAGTLKYRDNQRWKWLVDRLSVQSRKSLHHLRYW